MRAGDVAGERGDRGIPVPDVIVRTAEGWLEPEPYVGREAAMRFHEQLRDTWAGVAPHRGAILRGDVSGARSMRPELEVLPGLPLPANLIGRVADLDPEAVGVEDEEGVIAR